MGEIIDISWLLRGSREKRGGGGTAPLFRLRFCGPDLHWVGLAGGVLAAAFAAEGFYTSFDDVAFPSPDAILGLRASRQTVNERGSEQPPGLVVVGADLPAPPLGGCDSGTVLLTHSDRSGRESGLFSGPEISLKGEDSGAEPLDIAAACTGGAARLLGVIGWSALEQALRDELTLSSIGEVERHLSTALGAYNRLLPWEGIVPEVKGEPLRER